MARFCPESLELARSGGRPLPRPSDQIENQRRHCMFLSETNRSTSASPTCNTLFGDVFATPRSGGPSLDRMSAAMFWNPGRCTAVSEARFLCDYSKRVCAIWERWMEPRPLLWFMYATSVVLSVCTSTCLSRSCWRKFSRASWSALISSMLMWCLDQLVLHVPLASLSLNIASSLSRRHIFERSL